MAQLPQFPQGHNDEYDIIGTYICCNYWIHTYAYYQEFQNYYAIGECLYCSEYANDPRSARIFYGIEQEAQDLAKKIYHIFCQFEVIRLNIHNIHSTWFEHLSWAQCFELID